MPLRALNAGTPGCHEVKAAGKCVTISAPEKIVPQFFKAGFWEWALRCGLSAKASAWPWSFGNSRFGLCWVSLCIDGLACACLMGMVGYKWLT